MLIISAKKKKKKGSKNNLGVKSIECLGRKCLKCQSEKLGKLAVVMNDLLIFRRN